MRPLHYVRFSVVLLLAIACFAPAQALAHSSSGELASWSPHGDAPSSGQTRLSVGCDDESKRKFYVSNSKTVFVNTNGDAEEVTRNELFRAIHRWAAAGDCPDVHMHWKWKTRSNGSKYRYVSRLEAANLSD